MVNVPRSRRSRLEAGAGPLIGLQVVLGPHIWRIAPAWAVVAGAMTARAPLLGDGVPLRLLGAVVLADSLWGLFWRLTAADGVPGRSSLQTREHPPLPYYRTRSPAGRALGLIRDLIGGGSWHELFIALASAAALSLLLGGPAPALTAVAWGVALWAWLLAQSGRRPAACDALLNVGLPWWLGWSLVIGPKFSSTLSMLEGWGAGETMPEPGLILGLAFTLLQWGAQRARLSDGRRMAAIWLGQASVLIALIGLHQMPALVLGAVLLLPSWWHLWRAGRAAADLKEALARCDPWWLAAMLLSAFLM